MKENSPINNDLASFQKVVVYYFSGTGNAKNVSFWLARVAEEMKIECRLINIAIIDRLNIEQPDDGALVVFVSPVHGFNYPPVMLHFLMRFPKGKNKVLLMNTRAGMLIGRWITPGLSGITFYLAALILWLKGFSIRSMFPVDLPSNWISIHPGLNERTVKYLHDKNKEKVTSYARGVFSGKSNFRGLYEIVQDALVSPISFGYYFAGRFLFAKTFYASGDCTNCDVCVKGCPVKAIIKVDNRPYWTFNCESCMKCMGNCPEKAIETGHGFIIGYLMLFSSVIVVLFYRYFGLLYGVIENEILKFVIETVLMLLFLGLWYRLIHYLLRFRFFERLVVYSSLTRYKFWGRRYKALKEK
ncbi:MAG: EFR1 family ferrodoxin [Lentimicrobium sp.]